MDSRWEIPRCSISLDSCSLGEGEFGRVVKATLVSPDSATGMTVAVKMLKGSVYQSVAHLERGEGGTIAKLVQILLSREWTAGYVLLIHCS